MIEKVELKQTETSKASIVMGLLVVIYLLSVIIACWKYIFWN